MRLPSAPQRLDRPLPSHLATREPRVCWDQHLTTTALAHDLKESTKDPASFAGNYVGGANMTLARKFDEHVSAEKPPGSRS